MEIAEEKAAFAELMLKHNNDAFAAALELHPENINRALKIAHEYPKDDEVLTIVTRFKVEGKDLEFLPGKGELAKSIWERMNAKRTTADDFAKLAKLYAEVRGYIDKNPSTVINNSPLTESEIDAKLARLFNEVGNDSKPSI